MSDPIQQAHKKSRPKPLCWTRVAMVTSLPSGTRSAGNQLKVCACVNVCMCVWICLERLKKTVMSSLLFRPHSAQDELVKSFFLSFKGLLVLEGWFSAARTCGSISLQRNGVLPAQALSQDTHRKMSGHDSS